MVENPNLPPSGGKLPLPTKNRHKEFIVSGQIVTVRDRKSVAPSPPQKSKNKDGNHLRPAETLTIEEVARQSIDGIDTPKVLSDMADLVHRLGFSSTDLREK